MTDTALLQEIQRDLKDIKVAIMGDMTCPEEQPGVLLRLSRVESQQASEVRRREGIETKLWGLILTAGGAIVATLAKAFSDHKS